MKHLSLILVFIFVVVLIPIGAVQAEWNCPPVTSPTATNLVQKDGYQAWLDFRPYWQKCEAGAGIIGVDLGEGIARLEFDNYIRYALYAYGGNGGVYQIDVSTNRIVTIGYPNQPTGNEGGAHGDNAVPPPTFAATEAVVLTESPIETPVAQRRIAGLTLLQWIGNRIGW